MRKLFWGCLVGGVLIFGSVFTLAQIAVRHPNSAIGRFLYGTGRVAAVLNPYSGFSPLVAKLDRQERQAAALAAGAGAPVEGIPDDPKPVGGEENQTAEPPQAQAAIVIPDEEPVPQKPLLFSGYTLKSQPETLSPVQHGGPFDPGTECPPAQLARATPSLMPYCEEACEETAEIQAVEQRCEKLHMPKACSECEKVAMPRAAEEEQEAAEPEGCACPIGGIEKLLRLFEKSVKKSCPEEKASQEETVPECREDTNYHRHYPGCPDHSGGCTRYRYPTMTLPVTPVLPEADKKNATPEDHSALQLMPRKPGHDGEAGPVHPEVDTMEMRPSDRPLSDYGTGPL